MEVNSLDRVLLIINEHVIEGTTRLQKYGFLMKQNYNKELEDFDFYNDWKALYYGPYSEQLTKDIESGVEQRLISKYKSVTLNEYDTQKITLTIKGRHRLRQISEQYKKIINDVYEMSTNLQKKPLRIILRDVYLSYPNYTGKSKIKDEVLG